MFSRARGPDTESWHKAESLWCASDRNEALTRAKNGEAINSPKCPADIIKRDYELGEKLAVQGTPAIFLSSGEMLGATCRPASS
jgi:thiol:disulfide interchange protein DsbC